MLLGGYCGNCDRYFFPKPRFCPGCLGTPESKEVGNEGIIHSFTVIRTKPPLGLPEPYSVGFVDLESSGLRVFSLLDAAFLDRLKIGQRVRLEVAPLGRDIHDEPCLRPFFKPYVMKQEG